MLNWLWYLKLCLIILFIQVVDRSMNSNRLKYKLVVLGNEAVGKTSILTRFMYDTFNPTYNVTIGIDFVCKNFYLQDRVVRLQLWDTAGQERFRSLIPSYIRDCAAALIVFDVTSRESFLGTTAWIRDIRAERGDDVVLVLVGNRCDMEAQRQVSTEEAQQHAQSLHVAYMETSAKTGRNVRELFTQIAQALPHASGDNAAMSTASAAGAGASAAPTRGGGTSVDVNQPASDRRYCCM